MKTHTFWDIRVWDGGSSHNHKHYVATKEAAEEWLKHNPYDDFGKKTIVVFNSYEELMETLCADGRRAKALAKLTKEEQTLLGL